METSSSGASEPLSQKASDPVTQHTDQVPSGLFSHNSLNVNVMQQ